jgi:prepilin-type N-terminal cleavage/methylation domain-containing protein
MKANRSNRSSANKGFSVVEMTLVIVVIGILATITIGGYGQWRKSTARREVQSDLHGVAAAMESKRTFNNAYPFGGTALSQLSFTASDGVTLTYKSGSDTTYCIEAASIKVPAIIYHLDSANGNKTPEVGVC